MVKVRWLKENSGRAMRIVNYGLFTGKKNA